MLRLSDQRQERLYLEGTLGAGRGVVSLSVEKCRGNRKDQCKGHGDTESTAASVPKVSGRGHGVQAGKPFTQEEEPRGNPVRSLG